MMRKHEPGLLTVFKLNIVPVTKVVHRCQKVTTRLFSGKKLCCFYDKYWAPRTSVSTAIPGDECRVMAETKQSPAGNMTATNPNSEQTSYSTDLNKDYDFDGFSSNLRFVDDYRMDTSIMKIMMPSMSIVTPWFSVGRKHLYDKEFDHGDSIIVWDPFKERNICQFVPRLMTAVDAITYPRGDALLEENVSSESKDTKFFISKTAMAAWSVDDTMLLTDLKNYNCIKRKAGEHLYMNRNGDILRWAPGRKMRAGVVDDTRNGELVGSNEQDHPSSSFSEIVKIDEKVEMIDDTTQVEEALIGDGSTIDISEIAKVSEDAGTVSTANVWAEAEKVASNNHEMITLKSMLSYMDYKDKMQPNDNLHIRAMADCKQNQITWDMYTAQMEISPSLAIGKHLGRAVDAVYAGNGFYSVRDCELVDSQFIFTSLFTNETLTNKINGVDVPFRETVAALKVLPSKNKYLRLPLIRFRLKDSSMTWAS